ncbi:hypothetical protein ACM66T_10260 [Sulfurimonas sp. ST-25]|uniref:hypothetical protein n=1 Tax=Sulfurimonas sp. ST-25 TaxID=3400151 RepID=UPI003A8A07BB
MSTTLDARLAAIAAITANAPSATVQSIAYMADAVDAVAEDLWQTQEWIAAKQAVIDRVAALCATETDGRNLDYLANAAQKLDRTFDPDDYSDIYTIGDAGTIGYGVAALRDSEVPAGWFKLYGHDDKTSPNYGNLIDWSTSIGVHIGKFYINYNVDNIFETAIYAKTGFVVHPAFLNAGTEMNGMIIDKYTCGNVNGIFCSIPGIDPCSTSTSHNPISNLNGAPPNRHGGIYAAVATRGAGYNVPSIMQYRALADLAKAHADAVPSTAEAAWMDVLPYAPKGCNNNALADTNDSGVTFTASGYSNCALTGSGIPFAKTTHNGQACGVADLNGNMWEVASGFTLLEAVVGVPAATDFKIIKRSVDLRDIINDDTTQGLGGAYDPDLYDALDLTGYVAADLASRYGNGTETVFEMNTDTASDAYKRTSVGIPTALGRSSVGSTAFGNDYFREYWSNQMAPLVGGNWAYDTSTGVFALDLSYYRTTQGAAVGGRASYFL